MLISNDSRAVSRGEISDKQEKATRENKLQLMHFNNQDNFKREI